MADTSDRDSDDSSGDALDVSPETESVIVSLVDDEYIAKQITEFRQVLLDKAEEESEFYLEERLLSLRLGAEFSSDLVSNSNEEEALPPEIERRILVRLVEAYYIGQGDVVALGRQLTSFHKALQPFWKETNPGSSTFSRLPGETSADIFEHLRSVFSSEDAKNPSIFFRAFCYAHHRLDYSSLVDDTLLDAYCLCFFTIQVLQGSFHGIDLDIGSIHTMIDDEFFDGKSHDDIELTSEDILWCFCHLLLRIGSVIRSKHGLDFYNGIFAEPYSVIMKEELLVARLSMDLRPESPASFYAAYRMVMDTRRILPEKMQSGWLEPAYGFAIQGLSKAEKWNDPFFLYIFIVIRAFWLPTSMEAPDSYSFGEIRAKIETANEYKREAKEYIPSHQFWFAEQHEVLLRNILKAFPIDDDFEITFPLMDCTTFRPIQPKGKKTTDTPLRHLKSCYLKARLWSLFRNIFWSILLCQKLGRSQIFVINANGSSEFSHR